MKRRMRVLFCVDNGAASGLLNNPSSQDENLFRVGRVNNNIAAVGAINDENS